MKSFVGPSPKAGDRRTVKKFLLFPRTYGRDWRWLEWADVIEIFSTGGLCESCFWQEVDWVNNRTPQLEEVEHRTPIKRINLKE